MRETARSKLLSLLSLAGILPAAVELGCAAAPPVRVLAAAQAQVGGGALSWHRRETRWLPVQLAARSDASARAGACDIDLTWLLVERGLDDGVWWVGRRAGQATVPPRLELLERGPSIDSLMADPQPASLYRIIDLGDPKQEAVARGDCKTKIVAGPLRRGSLYSLADLRNCTTEVLVAGEDTVIAVYSAGCIVH